MITCDICNCDCSLYYWTCDLNEGQWCSECFATQPCAKGSHGEGCSTQVFESSFNS